MELGKKAVPMGPRTIMNRVVVEIIPRLFNPAFLEERERTTRDERDSITTAAVTNSCMKFWKLFPPSPLTQGNKE